MTRHFFIAGAQRSGSTYLHTILSEHPEIEVNQPWWPEPKFFLQPDANQRIEEYVNTYFTHGDASLRGEKSVCYMEHPEVAERLANSFPDARILFILRNPVHRAISNYWYSVKNGFENESIEKVLMDESYQVRPYDRARIIGCPPYHYLKRGKYLDYLENYFKHFDAQHMKILVFEEFICNRNAVRELFTFLGISAEFVPLSIDTKVNAYSPEDENPVNADVKSFLYEYYAESNAALARRWGLDLSKWHSSRLITL